MKMRNSKKNASQAHSSGRVVFIADKRANNSIKVSGIVLERLLGLISVGLEQLQRTYSKAN